MMKIIGITGGVGAGKTQVLSYIEEHYNCRVIRADEVAHLLYEPGEDCYNKLVALLGEDIIGSDKKINKPKMASLIFNDSELLDKVNKIVHPAVREYITAQVELERKRQKFDYVFVEAALLIEEHYDEVTDEIWYIYASEEVRRARLSLNRDYSDEKIASIMAGQLSEDEFRKNSQAVISNNGNLEETYTEIRKIMGDSLYESIGNQR
jgi:dephospho-CoA kinase